MSSVGQLAVCSRLILVAARFGSVLPLFRNWFDATFRLFPGVAAGVLLGAAFPHVAPDALGIPEKRAGWCVLAGLVGLHVIEKHHAVHIRETRDRDVHAIRTLGWATFAGFSVHAIMDRAALGWATLLAVPRGAQEGLIARWEPWSS